MYDLTSKFAKNSPLPCWSTHVQRGYKKKNGRTVPNCVPKSSSPAKQTKGGGTKKVCLPAAKIRGMSESKRKSLASAKSKAGKAGKYRRPSSTNVKGARRKNATLRDWFKKEDWRQVGNPSKKCGEK